MKKGRCIGKGRNASVYEWGSHEVLKLFNKGLKIGSEAENCRIIKSLGIPSPEVMGIIEIDGCEGIIFQRIDGVTMARAIDPNKESLLKHAKVLAELQVMINSIGVNYTPNLIQELSSRISNGDKPDGRIKAEILEGLSLLPVGNEICHFDFHPDNVIMSPGGPVIIDWAKVLVGNPLADAARTSLLLGSNALPPGECPHWLKDRACRRFFHDAYLDEYLKLSGKSKISLEPWIRPLAAARLGEGIPEEEEYLLTLILSSV